MYNEDFIGILNNLEIKGISKIDTDQILVNKFSTSMNFDHTYYSNSNFNLARVALKNKKSSNVGQNPSYDGSKDKIWLKKHYCFLCKKSDIHKVNYSFQTIDDCFGLKNSAESNYNLGGSLDKQDSSIPLLAGPFSPKMVKTMLVQNYVMNHNQSISYFIDSAHLFSAL